MPRHARKTGAVPSSQKANPLFGAGHIGMAHKRCRDEDNAAAAINSEIFSPFAGMMDGNGYFKSGNGTSREMQQLTNEILENYSRHMAKLVEFSNEAMRCDNVADMIALNARAVQYLCSDYVNETLKLSGKIFGREDMAWLCGFKNKSEQICEALGA